MKRYVDKSKCDGCQGRYLCVKDCVTSFLEAHQTEESRFANFKQRGYCIDCGHCNAICPKGAIVTEKEDIEIDDTFLREFSMKRTIRSFDKNVEIVESDLNLILLAGQSAPTEKNKGTVRIVLIKERLTEVFFVALELLKNHVENVGPLHPQYQQILDLYEKKEPIFWGAEYAVVIIGRPEFTVDGAIAAERMQLEAASHGIGSGYNGNLKYAINNSEKLKEIIGVKKQEEALVCFALGHTNIRYTSPHINKKKKVVII